MAEQCERPSELVRQAFRELSDPSPDKGFAALRCAEEVVSWLEANTKLHSLAAGDQPVEIGACLIADAIESATDAPAQLAGVQATLDELAARVRAHGP